MDFATWLTGQTGREDATGRVAMAVTNHLAEGWTPRTGSADEVRRLAPALGLDLVDVDMADARYRADHMVNPFRAEELEMRAAQ
ncbi:hypothetical protein J7E91_22975 [Streptomyces sp. ISL-99]|uniref:hypothetical protein n=1 Tax=Streptomyces sp. ISL-99 TaxID=2819193 RepID=UPI001BE561BC|nr:hypothetical protein [Streptomyces sp. ISL-99]MBT2528198.1 hypothetical protein [Streptomyces sp. ISL-99]